MNLGPAWVARGDAISKQNKNRVEQQQNERGGGIWISEILYSITSPQIPVLPHYGHLRSAFCCYVKRPKATGMKRVISSIFQLTAHYQREPKQKLSRYLEQKLKHRPTVEGCCVLVCFPWIAPLSFLHSPAHLPRDGIDRVGLGPPPSIKKVPHRTKRWRQVLN